MSKKQIHTNLIGRKVRLTEEASQYPKWHSNHLVLWKWGDTSDPSTAEFQGDYANIPGGKNATAEIVAIYLNPDYSGPVASIMWHEDGTILNDISIKSLQVIHE